MKDLRSQLNYQLGQLRPLQKTLEGKEKDASARADQLENELVAVRAHNLQLQAALTKHVDVKGKALNPAELARDNARLTKTLDKLQADFTAAKANAQNLKVTVSKLRETAVEEGKRSRTLSRDLAAAKQEITSLKRGWQSHEVERQQAELQRYEQEAQLKVLQQALQRSQQQAQSAARSEEEQLRREALQQRKEESASGATQGRPEPPRPDNDAVGGKWSNPPSLFWVPQHLSTSSHAQSRTPSPLPLVLTLATKNHTFGAQGNVSRAPSSIPGDYWTFALVPAPPLCKPISSDLRHRQ